MMLHRHFDGDNAAVKPEASVENAPAAVEKKAPPKRSKRKAAGEEAVHDKASNGSASSRNGRV